MSDPDDPMLVLDLGHSPTQHQARCRQCRWKSAWQMTAEDAGQEHLAHLRTRHATKRRAA